MLKRFISLYAILALAGHSHGQTTSPTLAPAAIPENVRPLLDGIRQAYSSAKSLEMSGTISFQFKAGDESRSFSAPFSSAFRAPTEFRHESKDDLLLIATRDKLFAFLPAENSVLTAAVPESKDKTKDIPGAIARLLMDQNPALLLALSPDPAVRLLEGAREVARAPDVQISGGSYPAISFTREKCTVLVAIDPRSHFLRQVRIDRAKQMKQRGREDVQTAVLTIDYANCTAGKSIPDSTFSFTPPKDAKTLKLDDEADDFSAAPSEQAMSLVGKPAPNFTLKDVEGKSLTLTDLKGSVVVLDFWATWCGPCAASMPHLDKLNKDKSPDGLKVFAINLREPKASAEKFVRSKGLSLPVLLDSTGEVGRKFLVSSIPQTVVIGKHGLITKVFVGFSGDDSELRSAVEAAMSAN